MMKHIFPLVMLVLTLGIPFSSIAQNASPDKRLSAKFDRTELKALSANDLAYWTYFLDHSFEIQTIPNGKEDGLHHMVSVKPSEMNNINILQLGLTPHKVARLYYGIEGTDKMICLYGQSEIDKNFGALSK